MSPEDYDREKRDSMNFGRGFLIGAIPAVSLWVYAVWSWLG